MAKLRGGISKRKFYLYVIGFLIFIIASYVISPIPSVLFYIPMAAVGISVFILYLWSASGGAYRAFITSYTGNSERSRLSHISNIVLINLFLIFTSFEEWILSAVRTIGMILETFRPSFRQMHRWNRSLEDILYSEAKVDYRGRTRNEPVPGLYDFSSSETNAAPRTEPKRNAFESLGVQGAEAFQKLDEALAEQP